MSGISGFIVLSLLLAGTVTGQTTPKKPLTHEVYDSWKSLSHVTPSRDGRWVTWEINPQQGDGWLYLYNLKKESLDSFPRGYGARFSPAGDYLVFKIKPQYAVVRKAKKEKKKKEDMPKDSLGILVLKGMAPEKVEKVSSFGVPEKAGSWFWYRREKIFPEKPDTTGMNASEETKKAYEEKKKAYDKKVKEIKKAKGTDLVVADPVAGRSVVFHDVTDQVIAKNGSRLAFITHQKDSLATAEIYLFSAGDATTRKIFSRKAKESNAEKVTVDGQGQQVAFLHSADTGDVKIFSLYYWKDGEDSARMAVDTLSPGMPAGWSVSDNRSPWFSEKGSRLFLGTAPRPEPEPEDTLLPEEKYHVDIWSWKDPYLQPMQKLRAEREKKRTWLAVWLPEQKKFVQLADKNVPEVNVPLKGEAPWALGTSGLPYRMLISWEADRYRDIYRIDVATGRKERLLTKAPSSVSLSPHGTSLVWWSVEDSCWHGRNLITGTETNLTGTLPVAFYNEQHDTPSHPYPYGYAGWYDDDHHIILYDRFDLWKVDVTGKTKPACLTNGYGRKNDMRFRRVRLDREKETISPDEDLYLSAFHIYNKKSGYYLAGANKPEDPERLVLGDFAYSSLMKPEKADLLFWRKGSFEQYPELWTGNMKMRKATELSLTNPQQSEYLWGTVELTEWTSFTGEHLQGLLYKPENFDPSKKYPMIVYFYERSSDGMHRYWAPAPSRSIINRSLYVSNGYLIFVPDITYQTGYPGQSAYNAVVSGTQTMVDRYPFIDRERLAMNGQSWGGYQIAYLVTQTDMFRCAFSGAPVSNMTSAYGGIRWGSGMSRMFQYEQTQSRIGGTLWEKTLQYVENSPIFFVPKIHTPLLIMHNDKDGAVPWYQGIEFFVALRRLGKPAWLLEYNNEDHNLTRRADQKDLSIRTMQFYDHYLKGKPAPAWMVYGIPATKKGKTDGYELVPEKRDER